MPKYYCDYCDIFLTHDSPSVRKSHNGGWKHKANVRTYYQQFEEDHTQRLIEAKVREWEARLAPSRPMFTNAPPPNSGGPAPGPAMNMPPPMMNNPFMNVPPNLSGGMMPSMPPQRVM